MTYWKHCINLIKRENISHDILLKLNMYLQCLLQILSKTRNILALKKYSIIMFLLCSQFKLKIR
jgi:hypothetical protein